MQPSLDTAGITQLTDYSLILFPYMDYRSALKVCPFIKTTHHVRANLGTGSKHQFTLSVGIVDLTRQECGEFVRPADRLIKEALPVAGAKKQCECRTYSK